MSLAEAAEARKERLIALRRRKLGQEDPVEGGENGAKREPFRFKQRNFDPETRTLKKHNKAEIDGDTVEKQVEGVAEQIIAEDEARRKQELDLFNIAPKRPNWDLKRDMEKKLNKLDRKTQQAINALIRKRLAAQQGAPDDLSARMKAQQDEDTRDSDSDEE